MPKLPQLSPELQREMTRQGILTIHQEIKSGVKSYPFGEPLKTAFAWHDINNWSIGFDRNWELLGFVNESVSQSKYPPYNIIKMDDDNYVIEIALAGFIREEIKIIQMGDGVLSISGIESKEAIGDYVHKGIATRDFIHKFALADYVSVTKAEFYDGILKVTLYRDLPEESKPKLIEIQ
jgi:molecular chaperone IbpA